MTFPGAYLDSPEPPCPDCWLPHTLERRLQVLRRMLPASTADVLEAHAHLWPAKDSSGKGSLVSRTLNRDLHRLGAVLDHNRIWRLR